MGSLKDFFSPPRNDIACRHIASALVTAIPGAYAVTGIRASDGVRHVEVRTPDGKAYTLDPAIIEIEPTEFLPEGQITESPEEFMAHWQKGAWT